MTITSLRQFAEEETASARRMFEAQGNLSLMFIGQNITGQRFALMVPQVEADAKDAIAEAVRQIFAEHGIVRYATMMESWYLVANGTGNAKVDTSLMTSILPSKHPDRKEGVFVSVRDDDECLTCLMEITRDSDGKPTLQPGTIEAMGAQEGRFADLLPRVPPTEGERASKVASLAVKASMAKKGNDK